MIEKAFSTTCSGYPIRSGIEFKSKNMKITINEPVKNKVLKLEATPETYEQGSGWRIDFPDAKSFSVTQETGRWAVIGKSDISPELINRIGIALHPISLYTCFNS
ncbi:hypothetical protein ABIB62_000815 [Mucilaginibacter sp. UYP25]